MTVKFSAHPPTWEMMAEAKSHLGMRCFRRLMGGVSDNQVNKFCRNPATTSDWDRDPLIRLRELLESLLESGPEGRELAMEIGGYLVEPLGFVQSEPCPLPDQPTLAEELLDTFRAFGEYAQACRERRPVHEVRKLKAEAKNELEEDFVMYVREIDGK